MSRGFFSTFGAGTTDKVTTGINAVLDKRSYSIWLYRNGNGGSSAGHVFAKQATGNQSENCWWNFSGGTPTYAYIRRNSANVPTANHFMQCAGGPQQLAGVWINLVITHDQSSGTLTDPIGYYNGLIQTSTAVATNNNVAATNGTFVLGQAFPANFGWDGLLAHFAAWDGAILTQAEAVALANGAHPMSIAPANIVGYLPLDGIHSPEMDYVRGNAAATLTGTRFGVLQPPSAPMYISSRDEAKQQVFLPAAAAAAAARQYAVSVVP